MCKTYQEINRARGRKIALIIDEEILESIAWFCAGELEILEGDEITFDHLEPKEVLEQKTFFMNQHKTFKRLEKQLDLIFRQLDQPGMETYRFDHDEFLNFLKEYKEK